MDAFPTPDGGAAARSLPAVVITGGSEGIGLEIARCFAQRGDQRLLLIARGAARLEAAAQALTTAHDVEVRVLALDLLSPVACEAIAACLADAGWHADVLVNDAGMGLSGPFADVDEKKMAALLRLNVEVPAALMRTFLPGMIARRRGGVLNVASLGGYVPGPGQAVYYASKAALISLTKSVREELIGSGVTMSVVVPGPVSTRFHAKMGADAARYRWWLPQGGAAATARLAVLGFRYGVLVVPNGLFGVVTMLAARLLPNFLLAPAMAWLLGPANKATP